MRVRHIHLELPLDHSYGRDIMRGASRYSWTTARDQWQISYALAPYQQHADIAAADGAIVSITTPAMAAKLQSATLPVINVAGVFAHCFCPRVTWDNVSIGRNVGQHLLSRGYTRSAFLCSNANGWFAQQRRHGFAQAMAAAGIEPAFFTRQLDNNWLKSMQKPLAVFAVNDEMGRSAIAQCRQLALDVPADVSVIAVNNDEIVCEALSPSLSSVALPGEQLGYAAAEALDQLMAGESVALEQSLEPGPIIVRSSSDMYATRDPLLVRALLIIRNMASTPLNVDELAHRLDTSRATLERCTRRELQCSPLTLLNCRLDRAMALLKQTNWPLQQIADHCGYSSASRLVEAFKRRHGCTPGSCR